MTNDRVEGEQQRQHDQLAVLDYIELYQRTHANRSPSQRHLCRALGIGVSAALHGLLHRLAQADLLRISPHEHGRAADLALTEAGRARLRQWRSARSADQTSDDVP